MNAIPLFSAPSASKSNGQASVLSLTDSLPDLTHQSTGGTTDRFAEGYARDTVSSARHEAERIIATAKAEASALLASARSDSDAMRGAAHSLGYAEGESKARAEIETELKADFEERTAALKEGVNRIIASILHEREQMWLGAEQEIIDFAFEIARKVIKIEIDRNDHVIHAVIADSLRRVSDRDSVRILVNPDELRRARARRDDILLTIDGVKNLIIDGDRRIACGGCVIETNAGAIDAKVDTQLEQVQQAIRA